MFSNDLFLQKKPLLSAGPVFGARLDGRSNEAPAALGMVRAGGPGTGKSLGGEGWAKAPHGCDEIWVVEPTP